MPEYLAPGVYVEETSFRAKSIEGVSTTTTGFVGPARFGPTDIEPELLTSLLEFERTYGDRLQLDYDNNGKNLTHNYLWHAVRAFFEEGGSRLYVSRVFQKKDDNDGCSRSIIPSVGDSSKNITVKARFPGKAGNDFRVRFSLKLGQNIFDVRRIDNKNQAFVAGLNDRDVVLIANKDDPFFSLDLLTALGLKAGTKSPKLGLFIANLVPGATQTWNFTNSVNSSISLNDNNGETNFENNLEIRIVTLVVSVIRDDETQVWDELPLDPSHHWGKTPDSVFDKFHENPSNIADKRQLPIVITRRSKVENGLNVLSALNSAIADDKGSLEFQVGKLCNFIAGLPDTQQQSLNDAINTILEKSVIITPDNINTITVKTSLGSAVETKYQTEPKLQAFLNDIKTEMGKPDPDPFKVFPSIELKVRKLCDLVANATESQKLCDAINAILGVITPDNINTTTVKTSLGSAVETKYRTEPKLQAFLNDIKTEMGNPNSDPFEAFPSIELQVSKFRELVANNSKGQELCDFINVILTKSITPQNINTDDTINDLLVDAIKREYSAESDKVGKFLEKIKTDMGANYPNPDPFEGFPKLEVSDLCDFIATTDAQQKQEICNAINKKILGKLEIVTPSNVNTARDLLVDAITKKYSADPSPDKVGKFLEGIKTNMGQDYPEDTFKGFPKLEVSDFCDFAATNSLNAQQKQELCKAINAIFKNLLVDAITKKYSAESDKVGEFLGAIKTGMGSPATDPFKDYSSQYHTLLASLVKDWLDDYKPKDAPSVTITLSGGNDGTPPNDSAYKGEELDYGKTGLVAFEDLEDISIVAAPGATAQIQERKEQDAQAIMLALISHAERMRYRIAVLDSVNNQKISEVRAFRAKLDSKHAALYFPWVKVLDPVTRTEIVLPPSGFVAGIYARNDRERAVYKAPANEVVRGALGFEMTLNKSQQEVLNPEGINCFRFFEGRGMRLWGARTISSDSEWKYVNLRRYFAYLERSIDKGTQWAVFEPNGEQLWANVRSTISDFLFNEWQSGALLGEKPEKSYFVKCDRSTMTQNDLDNGRLICLIGVAPLRPAEFVIFRIGQWTADRKV